MGTGKKEASRRERQGKGGDGLNNVKTKGENFYHDAKKVKHLNMYKDGKAQRNAEGTITKAASYQSRDIPNARIEPNRKWFTNTRVVSQDTLNAFREAMDEKARDPYQVLLKSNKLPMSLIRDGGKETENGIKKHKAKMTVETSPFAEVFGPKAQRKRVKLGVSSLDDMAGDTEKSMDTYRERLEQQKLLSGASGDPETLGDADKPLTMSIEPVFDKGQSKRIWNELYKVIDSSDVVIHVLDARDPVGTRCLSVEKYLKEEAPHKHLIFVLNKCDLVPTSVAVSFPLPFSSISSPYTTPQCSLSGFVPLCTMEPVCYNVGRLIASLDCRQRFVVRLMCAVLVTIMRQVKCQIELKSAYAINQLWGIDCILLSDDTNISSISIRVSLYNPFEY
jgi:nuclear GTP-binding protein